MRVDLGRIEDFQDKSISVISLESKQVAVAKWDGQVFVFRNICPHHAGPIGKGMVMSCLGTTAGGELVADEDKPVVVCPWHRWEFALPTGLAVRDPRYRIRTYPAWVEDGRLIIEASARADTPVSPKGG